MVHYDWDHRNRLIRVRFEDDQGAESKRVEYDYNIDNLRIEKRISTDGGATNDSVSRYALDGSDVLLVFDDTNSVSQTYFHGPGVDQILAVQNNAGEVLWALADHQGTVRDWLHKDDTTTPAWHLTYGAFGEILSATPKAVPQTLELPDYSYTGREWDADAELFYYRNRWYDPSIGRFVNDDLIGFAGGDTNLQRYVGNNAPNAVDPSGLQEYSTGPGIPQELSQAEVNTLRSNGFASRTYSQLNTRIVAGETGFDQYRFHDDTQAVAIPVVLPDGIVYHAVYRRTVTASELYSGYRNRVLTSAAEAGRKTPFAFAGALTTGLTATEFQSGAVVRSVETNIDQVVFDQLELQQKFKALADTEASLHAIEMLPIPGIGTVRSVAYWANGEPQSYGEVVLGVGLDLVAARSALRMRSLSGLSGPRRGVIQLNRGGAPRPRPAGTFSRGRSVSTPSTRHAGNPGDAFRVGVPRTQAIRLMRAEQLARSASRGFDNLHCQQCANSIAAALDDAGESYVRISVTPQYTPEEQMYLLQRGVYVDPGRTRLVRLDNGQFIGNFHEAILKGRFIFDNHHHGVTPLEWLNNLAAQKGSLRITVQPSP